MNAEDVVLLGVKNSIIAFERQTGVRLWQQTVPGSLLGRDFVSLAADDRHVYAHSGGEFCCLELQSGRILWKDELSGLGYGLGCVAIPNGPSTAALLAAEKRRRDSSSSDTSASASGS